MRRRPRRRKSSRGSVTLGFGDDLRSAPVAAALELGNSRGELKRSLKEGIMPPWRQEGVLLDVSKMSNDMLVSADAVYNKELRYCERFIAGTATAAATATAT